LDPIEIGTGEGARWGELGMLADFVFFVGCLHTSIASIPSYNMVDAYIFNQWNC